MTEALAVPDDDLDDDGLDDLEESVVPPRLNIDHTAGVFVDSLSGEKFAALDVIALGLVRQRILWPATMGETKEEPLCRSLDAKIGRPGEKFPWAKVDFVKADAARDPLNDEQALLPCGDCPLQEWGSHPTRENTPWCQEQFVVPVLMELRPGVSAAALLTFQRGAITPIKKYLQSYKRAESAPFTAMTHLALDGPFKRGTVVYHTPVATKGEATPEALWPEFATKFRAIRTFLQTVRRQEDEAEPESKNSRLDDDDELI